MQTDYLQVPESRMLPLFIFLKAFVTTSLTRIKHW